MSGQPWVNRMTISKMETIEQGLKNIEAEIARIREKMGSPLLTQSQINKIIYTLGQAHQNLTRIELVIL